MTQEELKAFRRIAQKSDVHGGVMYSFDEETGERVSLEQTKKDIDLVEKTLTNNKKVLESIEEYAEETLSNRIVDLIEARLELQKEPLSGKEVALERIEDMTDIVKAVRADLRKRLKGE